MFDIGWQELFIIGLVAIIVIGPKDLPRVLRTVTLGIRKLRGMARDFQDGIDELAREADLQDLRKEIEQGVGGDLKQEIESIGDTTRDLGDTTRELEDSMREIGGALDGPEKLKTAEPAQTPAAPSAPASPDPAAGNKKPGGDA